jgi:hypothetical protein
VGSVSHIYTKGSVYLFLVGGVVGLAPGACWRWGLRGIGPALAGNVGASWAFALSREGDQDVDVPMLAPARSRCRLVDWGYVPGWDGLMVAIEEKQSSLTRCVVGLAPGACWRWGLRGIGPALAGNVGAGWAFALSREGDQGVDVPMLAPARSRCRFVDWGYVPGWDGLMVAIEEKQSSLIRCVVGLAPGACWRWGLRGIGPALAGNVGAGSAFALAREGDQDVDVPMLAPARSRCRPGCPQGSVTLPKAYSSQRVGTGFLAASLSARGFVGSGNLDSQLGSAS